MKSKIAGCTHHSSKVISKFRNGGEVGGIGGGMGADGSGNRGMGGFGGGNSSSQGGGGMGGGGKGGVGGTGVNSSVKTGTMMRNTSPAMKMAQKAVPTSAKPNAPSVATMPAKPKPVGMAAPKAKPGLSFKYNVQLGKGMGYGNYIKNPTSGPAGSKTYKGR